MSDLFTLDDAKSWLGIDPASTDFDDQLADIIASTRTIIETRAGTLGARTETYETFVDYPTTFAKIVLPHHPITAVTSITVEDETLNADTYTVVAKYGIVRFRYGIIVPYNVTSNALAGDVIITYTVGSDTVTDNIALAAKIIAQDLWQEQMIQTASGQDIAQVDPTRYLWPRRAMMLVPKRGRFA